PVVTWREDAESVTFRLDQVAEPVGDLLVGAGWTVVGSGWEKAFPREAYGLSAVQRNLPRLAGSMLRQMVAPTQPWEEALAAFAERASAGGVDWWLTGSAATALRVPGIEPHDLDIMLDESQLVRVAEVF